MRESKDHFFFQASIQIFVAGIANRTGLVFSIFFLREGSHLKCLINGGVSIASAIIAFI